MSVGWFTSSHRVSHLHMKHHTIAAIKSSGMQASDLRCTVRTIYCGTEQCNWYSQIIT